MSEFDARYVTKQQSRDFHQKRTAFVIYENSVHFIEPGSSLSHWEFCQQKFPHLTKEEFNCIIRGYYLNNNLVFYKDNFLYDSQLISEALKYIPTIKQHIQVNIVNINFGLKVGNPGEIWPVQSFYGTSLENNKIKINKK